PNPSEFIQPAVYVCRHHNVKGPILSLAYLPIAVRPWVYHVFMQRASCYRHCADYTFSKRFGWHRASARAVAWVIAPAFARLLRSAGGIPVHRGSAHLMGTFRLSADALARGESLLVFPDVDYTSQVGDTGALYEGFLLLDRMYHKRTGGHIAFVPLHISDARRALYLGEPARFDDGVPYDVGRARVLEALKGEMNRLSIRYGE
ncbi:MAG: glycerol acyltransferase, partial [Clostridiales bacterium]|nr:glycerol acyltransferase [Clostridiales bacterium]